MATQLAQSVFSTDLKQAEAIFARLKEDHDTHRELLDKISETHGDSDERNRLFRRDRPPS